MGEGTKISWAHNTHNLWWGCTEVGNSPACDRCYARTLSEIYGYKEGGAHFPIWGNSADRRYFKPAHYARPLIWNRRAANHNDRERTFVMSMGDWAEGRIEQRPYLKQFYGLVDEALSLDFLMLTKRPQLIDVLIPENWLKNPRRHVWMGVTAENQYWFEIRWKFLKQIPASIYWISVEPMTGPITLPQDFLALGKRAWVIAGGGTAQRHADAQPIHPNWARHLRDQCIAAGVPFHFKQWGDLAPVSRTDGIHELPFGDYDVESKFGFIPIGTKAAGRLLDNVLWRQFPEAE